MLTELCQYLKNWFDRNQPKYYGKFEIKDGVITSFNDGDMQLLDGQYFRIIGSVLNDGVYQYPADGLKDETFDGAVWGMAIPPDVISLAARIEEWRAKYENLDNPMMSPYINESFGGYSYTKARAFAANGGDLMNNWQTLFGPALAPWRKL